MRVTEHYHDTFQFYRGSSDVKSDFRSARYLRMAVERANVIEDHRIEIETHEDPADPREKGAAADRLEAMRRRFLAGSTNLFGGGDKIAAVTEVRLDMRIHRENCCREIPNDDEEYARRAEIRMFPPVRSQGAGTPFLDSAEVSILGWARRTALIGNDIPKAVRVRWPGKSGY